MFTWYLTNATKVGHFTDSAANKTFDLLQFFVHSKSKSESDKYRQQVLDHVTTEFNLLPPTTDMISKSVGTSKKIILVKTRESAWGCFNRHIVHYILDRSGNVCLYAWIRVGINVSSGRGPYIESYNANQKFYLQKEGNKSFVLAVFKVSSFLTYS